MGKDQFPRASSRTSNICHKILTSMWQMHLSPKGRFRKEKWKEGKIYIFPPVTQSRKKNIDLII
jgi:hypothetical protein